MNIPELLSPAGSPESLYAAVENGADAVYFGISTPKQQQKYQQKHQGVFNARSRAESIPLEQLAGILSFLHSKNVKGYITLNTLVFSSELPEVESLLREIAAAGADAVLIQDFGIAKLAKRVCPELPLHASTQMSLTSLRGIEAAVETFGIKRIVVPRELSIAQIRQLKSSTGIELECFVHGALCISFSGQCFASIGLGGCNTNCNINRSANRGCCAQPCRLPYTLIDGISGGALSSSKQLLSPCDLSALPVLEELVAAGIDSLKIEGRLKPPEYAAETTRIYRQALAAIAANPDGGFRMKAVEREGEEQLEVMFSRGFSTGWLREINPAQLVPGNVMSHRGTLLGTVIEVRRDAAVVQLSAPVKCGDGVIFGSNADGGNVNDSGVENNNEEKPQGGRVYEIFRRGQSVKEAEAGAKVLLTFANHSLNAEKIHSGQTVRKTDDPHYRRSVQRSLEKVLAKNALAKNNPAKSNSEMQTLIPLVLRIEAAAGKPLCAEVFISGKKILQIFSSNSLEIARKHPLSLDLLKEQFSRLGGTAYSLAGISAVIEGNPMLPLSELGRMRHSLLEQLDSMKDASMRDDSTKDGGLKELLKELQKELQKEFLPQKITVKRSVNDNALLELQQELRQEHYQEHRTESPNPVLHLLLRDAAVFEKTSLLKQISAAGCTSFYAELQTMGEYHFAAKAVRNIGGEFTAVLPRIIKPAEERILAQFAKIKPDAFLIRNLEELAYFRSRNENKDEAVPLLADFSFNAVNELSFAQLLDWGFSRITPGWDCAGNTNFLRKFPAEKTERILIGRIPLFTTEHCLWKGNLIKNGSECQRLCRTKPLKIKDRYGALHTVRSDILCKNTVANAETFIAEDLLNSGSDSGSDSGGHWRIEWDERLQTGLRRDNTVSGTNTVSGILPENIIEILKLLKDGVSQDLCFML